MLKRSFKIVHSEKHSHATGELLAHDACLVVAVSTSKDNACLPAFGSNHDPTLWTTIIRQRRRIFHQLELKYVNEEMNSGIVVPHHQRDEFKIRHRGADYS